MGDPFSLCPWNVIVPVFHGAEGTEDATNAAGLRLAAVIWGAGVAFHLLQWKMGDSQTSLLFPAWPEALGVEQSKALAPGGFSGWEVRLGSSGMLSPGLEVGPASHRRRWVRVRAAPGQGGSADFGCVWLQPVWSLSP